MVNEGKIAETTADNNSQNGFIIRNYAMMESAQANGNGAAGLQVDLGGVAMISNCVLRGGNSSFTVVGNDQTGIAGGNLHVLGNYIYGNSGLGISTTPNLFGFGNNTVMVNNTNGLQNTTPVLLDPNGCSAACQGE